MSNNETSAARLSPDFYFPDKAAGVNTGQPMTKVWLRSSFSQSRKQRCHVNQYSDSHLRPHPHF